ncbi:Hypothetical protein, putative [Bodo saltans]|uniref:Membrane-associated protein n=1 Tax=Bodo saltans TaxID=75058 RepID=A0A0S4J8V8_BODSA|nr:Hypothetical protein, putative [Bodo saltans]|eukprot:CUG84771.1 Hypothetical protein, putative [Bodo saltans]
MLAGMVLRSFLHSLVAHRVTMRRCAFSDEGSRAGDVMVESTAALDEVERHVAVVNSRFQNISAQVLDQSP